MYLNSKLFCILSRYDKEGLISKGKESSLLSQLSSSVYTQSLCLGFLGRTRAAGILQRFFFASGLHTPQS
ncbi:hypothetical protein SDJN03_12009, partial [Cucurbita argyrosperma subsp. sororia]